MSKGWQRRTFTLDDGAVIRQCFKCKAFYELSEGYYPRKRNPDGSVAEHSAECKSCSSKATVVYKRQRREAPGGDAYRKRESAREAARRRADPEVNRKHRESQRRAREKVRNDPKLRAERAEAMRLRYRLRREAEGAKLRKSPKNVLRANVVPEGLGTIHNGATAVLPSGPIVALVERTLEQRRAVAGLIEGESPTIESVCADLGISARRFRAWRDNGDRVTIGVAERVLMNADVPWFEVYSYDDYAHVFSTAEVPV